MPLSPQLNQNLVLFLLMALGFAAGKAGVLKAETTRSLSRFLLDFTLPALIVTSMQTPFTPELRNQAFRVLGLSTLVYGLSFPLAFAATALYRGASRAELGVHRFAMCFSNVAFMGFPVAEAVLGRESLFMVSVYNIPFQVFAFSVGAALIAGSRKRVLDAKVLLNPAILAALAGFALFLLSVRIPDPFLTALELTGSVTTPLSMALIGATLAGARLGGVLANARLWTTVAYRLALFPLAVFALARALGLRGFELTVPVLIAAMPVAANTTILATVYDGDAPASGGLVFASTVLSLVSIPLVSRLFP